MLLSCDELECTYGKCIIFHLIWIPLSLFSIRRFTSVLYMQKVRQFISVHEQPPEKNCIEPSLQTS